MRHFLLLPLLFFCLNLFGEEHKIYGKIFDRTTGTIISNVSISCESAGKGTFADKNGHYEIMLPDGDHVITVETVGYKTINKKLSIKGKDKHQDFHMDLDFEELDEVKITKHRPDENVAMPTLGIQRVDAVSMKKMPSLMGEVDVIKVIQLMPGVQSAAEGTSGFSVRGGKADQNLILLDDACLYNASHMMGFFSIFNNDVVSEATLLKGDIPSQYGGRLSSVLKVETKEGFPSKVHGSGGIGLISSHIKLDVPIISNKTALMVAARRTYADLFLPLSQKESLKDASLFFYDMNAKLSHKINDKIFIFI